MTPSEAIQFRRLTEACKLVLLFHSGDQWGFAKSEAWINGLTTILGPAIGRPQEGIGVPTNEATTKNLCDAVRAALK